VKAGKINLVNTIAILSSGSSDKALNRPYIRTLLDLMPDWNIQIIAATEKKRYELLRDGMILEAASKGRVFFTQMPPACEMVSKRNMLATSLVTPEFWESIRGDRVIFLLPGAFFCGGKASLKLANILDFDYYGYSKDLTPEEVINGAAFYRRSAVIEVLRANKDRFDFFSKEKKPFCAECEIRNALVAAHKHMCVEEEGKQFISGKQPSDRPLFVFLPTIAHDSYAFNKYITTCDGLSMFKEDTQAKESPRLRDDGSSSSVRRRSH